MMWTNCPHSSRDIWPFPSVSATCVHKYLQPNLNCFVMCDLNHKCQRLRVDVQPCSFQRKPQRILFDKPSLSVTPPASANHHLYNTPPPTHYRHRHTISSKPDQHQHTSMRTPLIAHQHHPHNASVSTPRSPQASSQVQPSSSYRHQHQRINITGPPASAAHQHQHT